MAYFEKLKKGSKLSDCTSLAMSALSSSQLRVSNNEGSALLGSPCQVKASMVRVFGVYVRVPPCLQKKPTRLSCWL